MRMIVDEYAIVDTSKYYSGQSLITPAPTPTKQMQHQPYTTISIAY